MTYMASEGILKRLHRQVKAVLPVNAKELETAYMANTLVQLIEMGGIN